MQAYMGINSFCIAHRKPRVFNVIMLNKLNLSYVFTLQCVLWLRITVHVSDSETKTMEFPLACIKKPFSEVSGTNHSRVIAHSAWIYLAFTTKIFNQF